MPKFSTLVAAPTRVDRGRLVPANRFDLNAGSLKTTLANVKRADQMNTVATVSGGSRIQISEARHKVLASLAVGDKKRFGVTSAEPGPIMASSNAMVLKDRASRSRCWVKTVFEIAGPAELSKPIFRAKSAGTAIDGSDLWTADLTLPVRQTRLHATQRQIDQMSGRNPSLTFTDIPSKLSEATLKLPYTSPEGRRVMELQGKVAPAGNSVSFTFTGDAISLAFKLLRDTDEARIELLSQYDVFEPIKAAKLKQPEKMFGTQAVNVSRLGLLRRADLSTVFGDKVRRADISAHRRADLSGARRGKKRTTFGRKSQIKGRAAILAAAQAAKLAKLTAQAAQQPKVSFAKQRIVVNMVHTLDFRGTATARLFVTETANGHDQVIRNPPWSTGDRPIRQIEEIDLRGLNIPDDLRRRLRVFASVVDVGVYHVIPSSYVIGRAPETGRLNFNAEVISDPVHPENSAVRVSLGLVPEISPTEELHLRAALERHMVALQPLGADMPALTMGFPTDLGQLPELVWGDQLSQASPPVLDGRAVLLTVTTKTLGFAKVLFDTLSTRNRVLSATLKFNLPDEVVAQCSVLVGLTRTCGPTVAAKVSRGQLNMTELAGHDQNVTAVVQAGEMGQITALPLPQAIDLTPDQQSQSALPNSADGVWVAESVVNYPAVVPLDTTRIHVDEMTTPIIFSTSLTRGAAFQGDGLQSLLIEVRLSGRTPIAVVMNADAATGFFDPQVVNLSVPLTHALSPGGRILDYRIAARFDNGTSRQGAWITQNYGVNPDISIKREAFA